MSTVLSLATVLVTIFGTEWLIDSWLGEAWRTWVFVAGLGLLALASALLKASGVKELTRYLRKVLIGAQIGVALRGAGLQLPWLRRGLRLVGVETEPETRLQEPPSLSRVSTWFLWLGWAGSLVGIGMVWTSAFGG